MCYCIDKDAGERRRPEVFAALEYEHAPPPAAEMVSDEEDGAPGLPPPVTQPQPQQEALPVYPEYSPEPSPGVSRQSLPSKQSLPGELPSQYEEEDEEAEGSQLLPGSDLF
jgi:hypothetical protein